ncbi:hypothetical protein ACHAWU_000345 [Discostella pseudostelligera]|uniref:Orc1-like AAA ATPase domain-containing protein n=1 Tax=Discostella pseudostelligera TaxID=259834 RepID=A0ABD3M8H0_9STRA
MESAIPHINDVLFGRGTSVNLHPGNRQFRSLVESNKLAFTKAKKNKQKRAVAAYIYNEIQSMRPPGRFLEEDPSINTNNASMMGAFPTSADLHPSILTKNWSVVDPEKALVKILKRLREKDSRVQVPVEPVLTQNMTDGGFSASHSKLPSKSNPEEFKFNDTRAMAEVDHHENPPAKHSFEGGNLVVAQAQDDRQSWSSDDASHLQSHLLHDNRSLAQQSAEPEGQVASGGSEVSKYLERIGLNLEADFLLHDTTQQVEQDASQHLFEYTLRQWIGALKPEISFDTVTSLPSSTQRAQYVKSALVIALKLTECILEAEKDERNGHGNPIPLASITPENVLIRARKGGQHAVVSESTEEQEKIEFVWVMSSFGDESATGSVMARLFAVGKVLLELFSTKDPHMEDDLPSFHKASIDAINLSIEAEDVSPTRKKHRWRSAQSLYKDSEYTAALESNGVPWSLCALVKNLLECRHDPFCDDDAYASFADLYADLQLMVYNPACFLDNIHIPNNPRLAIPENLYGRDEELLKLKESYENHITDGKISGVVISGGAGAGKSKLASHMQSLTVQFNGYFLSADFEQNQMSHKPLSTITILFDSLCEMLLTDSSGSQLMKIENELMSALGSQPSLLGVVPNLRKLMPSCLGTETSASSNCVDSAVSMRYLLCELLRVISSNSKPITIVFDDIQFADHASLLLVGSLLFKAQGSTTFFVLCHRDDGASMSEQFTTWLRPIAMLPLDPIRLESLTPEAVNNLISEALHLSPRLTRLLSTVLHRKTRGNPLFVRQLLDSLTEQGYIYIDLKQHRWAWDLEMIIELEISENVLALFTNDIQRLSSDLQFGLQVAACIGSYVNESMLNYLSTELGFDLKNILQQASEKGFMIDIDGSTMFRFAHDKIHQAAYELMPERQRRENHMRFGLALCTQSLINIAEDEELFFAAVNQINQGGPTAVLEPSQKNVFAQLNLKAGKRAIELSDYNTAFTLFQHGISFLGDDDWKSYYQLSLDLYDAVAEAALILNKLADVTTYTDIVVLNARCFDDKLHCLITATRALGVAYRQEQSIRASFAILAQFGENLPSDMGDDNLSHEVDQMNNILRSMSDDMICNMQESNDKKMVILISLYETLAHVLQYFKPWLARAVSLRMIELTMKTGLSAKSPLVFAHFGGVLVTSGQITDGCRLGRLALKLVERSGSLQYKSSVICFTYDKILWASEPFQLIVEAHLLGHKSGQQSGDNIFAIHNLLLAILTDYVTGQSLVAIEKNILDFISKLEAQGLRIFFKHPILLLAS